MAAEEGVGGPAAVGLGWAVEKRGKRGRKEAGHRPNERKGEFFNSFAFSFPISKPHSNMNQIKFE